MARAIELAERGRGTVRPNPLVGCVVVAGDEVVGEGWHERAGRPHAEVVALRAAGGRSRGATVYVTLEPCRHQGRTPACTGALLDAGVARVVFALEDPDEDAGGGAAVLRQAGVEVTGGVLSDAAAQQNEEFLHVRRTGRPFVTLKLAQSLDGRAAAADGSSRWITSERARVRVHQLRADSDAVVVGSGTVLSDDPRLSVRDHDAPLGQPRPVVLDTRGRTPPHARAVREDTLVITTPASEERWRAELEAAGTEVAVVDDARTTDVPEGRGGVRLDQALAVLHERGLDRVLCEGGPTLAGALVRAGLADRLILHIAPILLGRDAPAVIGLPGAATMAERGRWALREVNRYGPDVELIARPDGA